jgi:hypothetical protein
VRPDLDDAAVARHEKGVEERVAVQADEHVGARREREVGERVAVWFCWCFVGVFLGGCLGRC